MNKKILFAFVALLMISKVASAQFVKVSVGINGGGLGTQMMTDPAPTNPTYFYLSGYGGLFTTINFGNVFGIRGAANYALQGGQYDVNGVTATVSQSYIQVPATLLIHAGRAVSFEFGFVQNILLQSNYKEENGSTVNITPDEGALKYNIGAVGGINFNFGKVVFLNLKYHYGLSKAYVIYGKGFPTSTVSAGLGFNIYTNRKSAFR